MKGARRAPAILALAWFATSCAAMSQTPGPGAAPAPAGTAPAPGPLRLDREPSFDIGLAWDLERLELEPLGPAVMTSVVGVASSLILRGGAAPLTILALADGMDVRWEAGQAHRALGRRDTLIIRGEHPTGAEDPLRVRWNGRTWRAPLRVFVNPRGKLTLAARQPLETYLLGVVPGEIGALSESLLEAGRAQAIAARSYTLFYRGRRGAEGFDLYGTVEDQLYGPVESERPLATRCVESTRGRIALSAGQAIRANYCSTCGGITAEVWEAWPAASLPYLASHLDRGSGDFCAASPQYRWREQWSAVEFVGNLTRFGPPLGVALPAGGTGQLLDVRVADRSRSGRVWRLEVTTTTGSISIPAYVLRQVLRRPGMPNSILRSNLFKVDVRRDPETRRALAVVASGAGSGHGVGLCQTGSLGMARAGKTAEQILAHYYSGIEVHRFY